MTVLRLLTSYEKWVKNGQIQFLEKDSVDQRKVLNDVSELISLFKKAGEKEGDLSSNLDWADAHQKGIRLWKALMSGAIRQIDPESQGQRELFKFVKAATEFEDLLYGLEPFYRDHTLHVLWVYFIGEHILRDHLPDIRIDQNWYLYNDIERESSEYPASLLKKAKQSEKSFCKKLGEMRDANWCVTALCHDLGYSLAKLDKLNDKARNVLKYFNLQNFHQIGYALNVEKQFNIAQFIELMASELRIVPQSDNKDILIKCYRDDSTYWRLCRALERKQHGILSAYLIYNLLSIFADTWTRDTAEQYGLEDQEVIDTAIRGSILFAIAQHEFDIANSSDFGGVAELLILADELEEFSRFGRPMLSRRYHDTMAESSVSFHVARGGITRNLEIDVAYNVIREDDLKAFFKRKSERLCQLYALKQPSDESWQTHRSLRITKLKLRAKHSSNEYSFCLNTETEDRAMLPESAPYQDKVFPAGEYVAMCRDDKIYLQHQKELISLSMWLGIEDGDEQDNE